MKEWDATGRLVWSFGNCSFDEQHLELAVDGEAVDIEARPLEVLQHLLHHAAELVTKDELLEAVWPGRIPSESVLTKAMAKLRQALRDEDQALIRTVYGQGYRLIAPVSVKVAPPALTKDADPSLTVGASPPLRPNWVLEHRLDAGGRNEVWRARHDKTGQPRVFKFARDAEGVRALKREITVFRLLNQAPSMGKHLLPIFDWNLDELPYFIECPFVGGGSLEQWFERTGGGGAVALDARLLLLAQAAEALSAAHDAGVLHKDIKPSNVLVDTDETGAPFVRLADFGSGRLIDLERLALLEITRLGFTQTVMEADSSSGTPLYLAPELLAGQAPSVHSDVYALGVMLYQLLVGDFRRPLAPGWEREVTDPLLREDIAACADLDPVRRIADARLLAQRLRSLDARRAQQGRIAAEREETERLRRRVERMRLRRPWLAASATLLLLGLSSATLLWLRAVHANEHAKREAALAEAVNEFLTDDLLARADPLQSGRRDVQVTELLSRASQRVETRFADNAEAAATVLGAIGTAYAGLSDYDNGERELRRAIRLLDGQPDELKRQVALKVELIWLLLNADRLVDARAEISRLESPRVADTESQLRLETAKAFLTFRSGNYDSAIATLEALRPRYEAASLPPDRHVEFLERLGDVYQTSGRLEHSLALYQDLLQRERALYGQRDARSINAMLGLGTALEFSDRNQDALPVLIEAERLARETLGEDHDIYLNVAGELAGVYGLLGRYSDAEPLYRRLVELCIRRHGEEHVLTRTMSENLATLYARNDQHEKALELYLRIYPIEVRLNGEAHPDTLLTADNIASSLSMLGRWSEALRWQSRTVELARKAFSPDDFHFAVMQYKYANILAHMRRTEEARTNFDQAIELLRRTLGDQHATTRKAIKLRETALSNS